MITTKCPHLIKCAPSACKAKALNNLYRPSAFQLSEYCRKRSHWKCPFYQTSMARGEINWLGSLPSILNTDKTLS